MHYFLGCPEWSRPEWKGSLLPTRTRPADFLAGYARVFNTVEGNTTFYALPRSDVVERWKESTPSDFRFCFKFPRSISHDRKLENTNRIDKGILPANCSLGGTGWPDSTATFCRLWSQPLATAPTIPTPIALQTFATLWRYAT